MMLTTCSPSRSADGYGHGHKGRALQSLPAIGCTLDLEPHPTLLHRSARQARHQAQGLWIDVDERYCGVMQLPGAHEVGYEPRGKYGASGPDEHGLMVAHSSCAPWNARKPKSLSGPATADLAYGSARVDGPDIATLDSGKGGESR